MDKSTVMKNYRFLALMLFAMVAGCVVGRFFPEFGHFTKPVGAVFINMVFCVVVPLVFVSIPNSVASIHSRKWAGKIMSTTVLTSVVTDVVAAVIMFIVVKLVPPVLEPWTDMTTEAIGEHASLADMIVSFFTTDDSVGLLSRGVMLPLIVFSIPFGPVTNLVSGPNRVIDKFFDGLTEVMMVFVKIITYYVPVTFFTLFADLVAIYSSSMASAYGRAMVMYYPLCSIYISTAFPLFACIGGSRYDIKTMFQHIARPAIMSLGTYSSSATIPTNLCEAEDTGIPKNVVDMVVPMGVTMYMGGSCFSCALKITFVLGAAGVDMPWTMLPAVVTVATPSSVGMSGVPGEGYIGKHIICSIFFPQQIEVTLPTLVVIGNLVGPSVAMVNSAGDYVVRYIVAHATDGKDWLGRAVTAKHAK